MTTYENIQTKEQIQKPRLKHSKVYFVISDELEHNFINCILPEVVRMNSFVECTKFIPYRY